MIKRRVLPVHQPVIKKAYPPHAVTNYKIAANNSIKHSFGTYL